jgi:outer membrane protein
MATLHFPAVRPGAMRISLFVALGLATLAPSGRIAAEFRIATVDVSRVLNESPEAKEKRAEIDRLSAETRKKIEAKRQSLKEIEAKLKEKNAPEDSKEVDDFREHAREFTRLVKDSEEDLNRRFMSVNKVLTDRALTLIRKYAESNRIDLVLDKSTRERGPVLYGVQTADITTDIMQQVR